MESYQYVVLHQMQDRALPLPELTWRQISLWR
jgi:hypothetical protein